MLPVEHDPDFRFGSGFQRRGGHQADESAGFVSRAREYELDGRPGGL
jgi:hypothetical protein